jgi:hypothetical protein
LAQESALEDATSHCSEKRIAAIGPSGAPADLGNASDAGHGLEPARGWISDCASTLVSARKRKVVGYEYLPGPKSAGHMVPRR